MPMEINEVGQALVTGPVRPMDSEESSMLINLMTLSRRHKDVTQFMEKSGIKDNTAYKMLEKYLDVLDGVTVEPLARVLISSLMSKPFECNLFIGACSYHAKRAGKTVLDLDDIVTMFPMGFPTDEAKLALWNRIQAALDNEGIRHTKAIREVPTTTTWVNRRSESQAEARDSRLLDSEGDSDVD